MKKRYAVVGVGQRSRHFIHALLVDHRDHAELAALCDANRPAMEAWIPHLDDGAADVPLYDAAEFDRMVADAKIDTVIVLTPDHTHDEYICRAMELGCDVITEKPLTTSVEKCQPIIDTQRRTGRSCRVTFNYRYAPWNTTIKELLTKGTIGGIVSYTLRHSLGHDRGPFYFHRWHAEWGKSGGLLIHKSTHYFDLANWWIGSVPKRVFARARQAFFNDEHARRLGIIRPGDRCADCRHAAVCPFFIRTGRSEPDDVEHARRGDGGYTRDMCVFRPEADVPDTMHVMVEYENGVLFNYTLVAFGQRGTDSTLYGTHGRLETGLPSLRVTPYYAAAYDVDPPVVEGGHGGGDPVMFNDLLDPVAEPDTLKRMATHHAGAWSAAIGMAANVSIRTGEAVVVRDLIRGLEVPDYPEMREQPEGFATEQMRAWCDAKTGAAAERKQERRQTAADARQGSS
jgi:predicted dehydrogenase